MSDKIALSAGVLPIAAGCDSGDAARSDVASATVRQGAFKDYLQRLRSGDEQLSAELVNRYSERLRTLAKQRLGHVLKAKVDPDDVLQSALLSFFIGLRQGKWDIESSQNLRGLLCLIVARKCSRQVERYASTAARQVQREQYFADALDTEVTAAIASEAVPESQIVEAELIEFAMNLLDETDRRILQLLLDGRTTEEVARLVNYSQRTIQRSVLRIIKHLQATILSED